MNVLEYLIIIDETRYNFARNKRYNLFGWEMVIPVNK